jgi:hypothetical protein
MAVSRVPPAQGSPLYFKFFDGQNMKLGLFSSRKIKITIIFVCLSLVIAYALGFWSASHSESYTHACEFAEHDARLAEEIGPLKDCRISSWFGYDIRYQGPNGSAEFSLNVVGQKSSGQLFVDLVTNTGEWQVQNAKLKLPDNRFMIIK